MQEEFDTLNNHILNLSKKIIENICNELKHPEKINYFISKLPSITYKNNTNISNNESKEDESKEDESKEDESKEDESKEDELKEDESKEDKSKEDKSKEDESKEDKSKEDKSKEDKSKEEILSDIVWNKFKNDIISKLKNKYPTDTDKQLDKKLKKLWKQLDDKKKSKYL